MLVVESLNGQLDGWHVVESLNLPDSRNGMDSWLAVVFELAGRLG